MTLKELRVKRQGMRPPRRERQSIRRWRKRWASWRWCQTPAKLQCFYADIEQHRAYKREYGDFQEVVS